MTILGDAIATANLEDLAESAALIVARCHATGLDPSSYRCALSAAVRLGITTWGISARWNSDNDYVGALIDLECDLFTKLQQISAMIARYAAALEAEYGKVLQRPKVIAALQAALEILATARDKATAALNRVMAAPDELTGTYAAAYHHVRSGRVLPFNGRFISGEVTA